MKNLKNSKLRNDRNTKEIKSKIKLIDELNTKIKEYENNYNELELNKNNILKENENYQEVIKKLKDDNKMQSFDCFLLCN